MWFQLDQRIRFLIIGAVNAAISYAIFAVALFILGNARYQLCAALQWVASSIFSYLNQKFFVFQTRGNYLNEYFKCCSTWFLSWLINAVLLELLIKFVFRNAYAAQFISIFLVSIVTYVTFKYFAFKKCRQ